MAEEHKITARLAGTSSHGPGSRHLTLVLEREPVTNEFDRTNAELLQELDGGGRYEVTLTRLPDATPAAEAAP